MFGLSIVAFTFLDFRWWWYPALILLPDIGMFGYAISPKVGAWLYNVFHHKGIALLILLLGWRMDLEWIILSGIILFGHASMDRIFGYGLKYPNSFKNTHLGDLK